MIVALISLMLPGPSRGDDYEEYLSSKKFLENYVKGMKEAQSEAAGAIQAAAAATSGDPGPWRDLDKKINYYKQVVAANLPSMDVHVDAVFRYSPSERLPDIPVPPLIERELNTAKERHEQIDRAMKTIDMRIRDIDVRINKFNSAILKANANLFNDTIQDTIPDIPELLGEAGVAFFGGLGALVTMNPLFLAGATAAGAAVLAFNGMVNLYYNCDSLAEQIKVFTDMMKLLQERKRYFQELKDSLRPALDEMNLIIQALETGKKTIDGIREEVKKATDRWKEKAEGATKARAERQTAQALAAINNRQPIVFTQRYYGYYSYYYGMDPIPPINPSDYLPKVKSYMDRLESACRAVEDGGEPHTYMEIAWSLFKSIFEDRKAKVKAYEQGVENYQQASKVCRDAVNAASQRLSAALQAIRARRWESYEEWSRACDAAWSAYRAAYQAAMNALKPHGAALREPYRNKIMGSLVYDLTMHYHYTCYYRIGDAVSFRTSQFWQLFNAIGNRFDEARTRALIAAEPIPATWTIKYWTENAKNLDAYVEKAIRDGANPVQLKSSLLSTAETFRETGKTVKEAVKNYNREILQVYLAANAGKAELDRYLVNWGKLINHEGIGGHWIPSSYEERPSSYPGTPGDSGERLKYIDKMLKDCFFVYEPENVKAAQGADWEGIASRYTAKAQELDFYIDWINKYEHQRSVAAIRIDKIGKDITGRGLYEGRSENPQEVLKKEFSEQPWAGIASQADRYVPADQLKKFPWLTIGSTSIRQKLYAGQNILLNRLGAQAKYYMDARSSGGFMPVQPSIIDPLVTDWKALRSLCEQFDNLAKPIFDKIGNIPEQINKEAAPVMETYSKMPAISRNAVTDSHRRFLSGVSWLQSYLQGKAQWTMPITVPPNNHPTIQLDKLLVEYEPLLKKYRENEERQRRMMEEMRKQAEERERQERERERLEALQREKDELQSVKDLYRQFKSAYENRNEPLVMSFISDQWRAGDGTILNELSRYLRDSFKVFNQIKYDISNLRITKIDKGLFAANYDLKITGRIFEMNIKHEENSQVNEEVVIDERGRAKIIRTMTGRFWQVR